MAYKNYPKHHHHRVVSQQPRALEYNRLFLLRAQEGEEIIKNFIFAALGSLLNERQA